MFRDLCHNPPPKSLIEAEYVLGREVGRGGSGIVMHALHKKSGDYCAIKIIENRGKKEERSGTVAREVSIMRRLQHSNICRMLDVFWEPAHTCEDNALPFPSCVSHTFIIGIVMEWVPNGDLMDYLETQGTLCKLFGHTGSVKI